MNLDTLLPALQEMNGRLETIAQLLTNQGQILVDGEERQRELARIQQKLVNLQEQTAKRSPAHPDTPAQNEQIVNTLNEILKGITILADASQQQVQAGREARPGPFEDQNEGIRQLLQDIKERLGDLATGVPASKDAYIDQQREKLVDDIYSKMQPSLASPEQAPRPTSRRPYSNMETPTSRETSSWDTTPRTTPESPEARPVRVSPPTLPEVDPKVAGKMDAIFAEEAAYLEEQKIYFQNMDKTKEENDKRYQNYLAERKEHIAQKKAWYLNLG